MKGKKVPGRKNVIERWLDENISEGGKIPGSKCRICNTLPMDQLKLLEKSHEKGISSYKLAHWLRAHYPDLYADGSGNPLNSWSGSLKRHFENDHLAYKNGKI